jgi:hypothetical protein
MVFLARVTKAVTADKPTRTSLAQAVAAQVQSVKIQQVQ